MEAIRSVTGDPEPFIPLHAPLFVGNEATYTAQTIADNWVSTNGEFNAKFETRLAEICGVSDVIATMNGTSALHLSLLMVGVRPGDEVLIPALTFVATANAVSHAGAIPHLCDAEWTTLGMDPAKLRRHLADIAEDRNGVTVNRQTGRRLAAIVPVHILGHSADIEGLLEVASEFGIVMVEDAAEGLGTLRNGVQIGSDGVLNALSFNGNKIVTTGGGGAIMTNDVELAGHVRHVATTAKKPHPWEYDHDAVGYNYRMPNLNAALGMGQLENLDMLVTAKRTLAARYAKAFAGVNGLRFFEEPPNQTSNYWLNGIVLDEEHSSAREDIIVALNDAGYGVRPLWRPMNELPMYVAAPQMDLSVATDARARIINIPSGSGLGLDS